MLTELRGDVGGGNVIAARGGGATFEQIARQEFDVAANRTLAHVFPRLICQRERGADQHACRENEANGVAHGGLQSK